MGGYIVWTDNGCIMIDAAGEYWMYCQSRLVAVFDSRSDAKRVADKFRNKGWCGRTRVLELV